MMLGTSVWAQSLSYVTTVHLNDSLRFWRSHCQFVQHSSCSRLPKCFWALLQHLYMLGLVHYVELLVRFVQLLVHCVQLLVHPSPKGFNG